jgi:hypothetical protein
MNLQIKSIKKSSANQWNTSKINYVVYTTYQVIHHCSLLGRIRILLHSSYTYLYWLQNLAQNCRKRRLTINRSCRGDGRWAVEDEFIGLGQSVDAFGIT